MTVLYSRLDPTQKPGSTIAFAPIAVSANVPKVSVRPGDDQLWIILARAASQTQASTIPGGKSGPGGKATAATSLWEMRTLNTRPAPYTDPDDSPPIRSWPQNWS